MYSASGDNIYWSVCCVYRLIGYYNTVSWGNWNIFGYGLTSNAPGFDSMIYGGNVYNESGALSVFGDYNGVYGYHGDVNPPIPYNGRLYFHLGNSILAFSSGATVNQLSTLPAPSQNISNSPISVNTLVNKLETEIHNFDVDGNGTLDHLRIRCVRNFRPT
jgi:hypothetical protein